MTLPCPPILFVVFNRPDMTAISLAAIREARPTRLYIAADGPRGDHPDDAELCDAARQAAQAVDWDCEVKTLFQEDNLGCQHGVVAALDWFFDNEEAGIIIEDDIVLDPTFFPFAAEMLERYRDDPQVMTVTAVNRGPTHTCGDESYFFAGHFSAWGWASWARAWKFYDRTLENIEDDETRAAIREMSNKPEFFAYWLKWFRLVRDGLEVAWDYPWMISIWRVRGLNVTPRENMVRNIGFGENATHTFDPEAIGAKLRPHAMEFPLVHPDRVSRDRDYDEDVDVNNFKILPQGLIRRFKNRMRGLA